MRSYVLLVLVVETCGEVTLVVVMTVVVVVVVV